MKKIFALYVVIAIICIPFIHSNNAEGYKSNRGAAYTWGKSIGRSLYWPSYIFTIEPEVNGESLDTFQQSIIDIVNYRKNKLFTGSADDSNFILGSISNCLALEYVKAENSYNISSIYNEVFEKEVNDIGLKIIGDKIIDKFDGADFADIVEEGIFCGEELSKKS